MTKTRQARQMSNPVEWAFDFDLCFMLEVETKSIAHYLPRGIYPSEARPGISLLTFSIHRFPEGAVGGKMPGIVEATVGVLVQPNLSIAMPLPRFAVYVIYVTSSCQEFMQYANEVDKMPVYEAKNLKCVISEDFSVFVSDDRGPMFELRNTIEDISFRYSEMMGQGLTYANGENLYCTPFKWTGDLCEHQDRSKNFGKVYNHPSLKGIIINEEEQNCYMQMFTPLDDEGVLTYWSPIKLY